MLNRYFTFSTFINQGLKLHVLPRSTCIRNYTLTYDEEEREKKRKTRQILINVIMPDQKVTSMTIEAAQKMAKRRDLTLNKLAAPPKFASYAGRDVYEVFTKSQHVKQLSGPADIESETGFKEKKTLTLSASIATHDINTKLKQVKKWLSKRHVVVIIVDDDGTGEAMKEKTTYIQTECQDGCKFTSVTKKKQMVLTLVPQQTNNSHDTDKLQKKSEDKDCSAPAQDAV